MFGFESRKAKKRNQFHLYFGRVAIGISIALTLIIGLIACLDIYKLCKQNEQQYAISYFNEIETIKLANEGRFSNINIRIAILLMNSDLNELMFYADLDVKANYLIIRRLQEQLTSLVNSDSLLQSAYIYFKKSDSVLSTAGVYQRQKHADDSFIQESFQSSALKKQQMSYRTIYSIEQNRTIKALSFVRSFPLQFSENLGMVILNIDQQRLSPTGSQVSFSLGVADDILQSNSIMMQAFKSSLAGNASSLSGGLQHFAYTDESGVNHKTVYTYSATMGYYIFADLPLEKIQASNVGIITARTKVYLLWLGLLLVPMFLILLLVSWILTRVQYSLESDQPEESIKAYDSNTSKLLEKINHVIINQQNMTSRIRSLEPVALQRMLESYLFSIPQTRGATMDQLTDEIFGGNYLILSIRFLLDKKKQTCEIANILLEEALTRLQKNFGSQQKCLQVLLSMDKAAAIISQPNPGYEQKLLVDLNAWIDEVNLENQMDVTIGVSLLQSGCENAAKAYQQAEISAKEFIIYGRNRVFTYAEQLSLSLCDLLIDSQSFEDAMSHCLNDFNEEGANQILATYLHKIENEKSGIVSIFSYRLLFVVYRFMTQFGVPADQILETEEVAAAVDNDDLANFCQIARSMIARAIYLVKCKRDEVSYEKIKIMIKFIEENAHADLQIESIASAAGFSTSHATRLFKDYTGKTILQFLTHVRMKKACDLLVTTNLPINKIAEKVGFGNSKNMIRWFKASGYASPSQYRDDHLTGISHTRAD